MIFAGKDHSLKKTHFYPWVGFKGKIMGGGIFFRQQIVSPVEGSSGRAHLCKDVLVVKFPEPCVEFQIKIRTAVV